MGAWRQDGRKSPAGCLTSLPGKLSSPKIKDALHCTEDCLFLEAMFSKAHEFVCHSILPGPSEHLEGKLEDVASILRLYF